MGFFRLFVNDMFVREGFSIKIGYEASNALGILGLVSSGLGISIYSESIARLQSRSIMIKSINDCQDRISTLLAWNRAYKTPALINFIAVARELYPPIK